MAVLRKITGDTGKNLPDAKIWHSRLVLGQLSATNTGTLQRFEIGPGAATAPTAPAAWRR